MVTAGAQEVSGEEVLRPAAAAALGAVRVLPQEYPGLVARTVDLPAPGLPSPRLLALLAAELERDGDEAAVALRGATRWLWGVDPLDLPAAETSPDPRSALRSPRSGRLEGRGADPRYLVLGAGGDFGLALAAVLARRPGARLVLAGRLGVPAREAWDAAAERPEDDPVGRRVRALREIEARAAALELVETDVSTPAGVATAFAAAFAPPSPMPRSPTPNPAARSPASWCATSPSASRWPARWRS